jgi:hypothetical protein
VADNPLVAVDTPRGRISVPADVAQRLGLTVAPDLTAGRMQDLLAPGPAAPPPVMYADAGDELPQQTIQMNDTPIVPFHEPPPVQAPRQTPRQRATRAQANATTVRRFVDPIMDTMNRRAVSPIVPADLMPESWGYDDTPGAHGIPTIISPDDALENLPRTSRIAEATDPEGWGAVTERQVVQEATAPDAANQAISDADPSTMVPEIGEAPAPMLQPVYAIGPEGRREAHASLAGVSPEVRQQIIAILNARAPGDAQMAPDGVTLRMGVDATSVLANANLLDPGSLQRVVSNALLGSTPEAPTGTGVPMATVEEQGQITRRAPVDTGILALQAGLSDTLQMHQEAAAQGQLKMNDLQSQGFAGLAKLRQAQVDELSAIDRDAAQRYERRLSELDQAIDAVGQQRIDPEAFWGGGLTGGLRRIGAAVSIALGYMAQTAGADTNAGLDAIQHAIEQNIQTQEANMGHSRALIGERRNAVNMFREALGDQRDAREATMAAGWEAATSRLQGLLIGARDPILRANAQSMIVGARLRQLQNLATLQQNQWEITSEITSRRRVPQTQVGGVVERAVGAAPAQAPSAPRAPRAPRAPGTRPAGQQRPRVNAPQAQTPAAPVQPVAEAQRPLSDFGDIDPVEGRAFVELDRAGRTTPSERPMPRYLVGDPDAYNRLGPERQALVDNTARNGAVLLTAMNRIIQLARSEGTRWLGQDARSGELTSAVGQAQAMIRSPEIANLGVPTGIDAQLTAAILSDPSDRTLENLFTNRPEVIIGSMRSLHNAINVRLGQEGFRLNTEVARVQDQERTEQRDRAANPSQPAQRRAQQRELARDTSE